MQRDNWSSGIKIGGRHFGGSNSVYIIAEIGSNHDGDLEKAKNLISACADAGVNAVKFQSWIPNKLQNIKDVNANGELIESTVIPILKKFEIQENWHDVLYKSCQDFGVDFLSTPFDISRARLLRNLNVSAIKISSGDLTYDELLKEVGTYSIPLFISTGMANIGEIEHALMCVEENPSREIVLLHCVGAYPPNMEDANILAIRTLADTFNLPVGLSDHYPGHDLVLAAVALGAVVIEKHVTFSREDGTPDSPFAMEINELKAMVKAVRSLEVALGDGVKRCRASEADGLIGGRRSLFAARDIKSGATLTEDDIAVVRPNISELKPSDIYRVVGKSASQDIPKGTPLRWVYLHGD